MPVIAVLDDYAPEVTYSPVGWNPVPSRGALPDYLSTIHYQTNVPVGTPTDGFVEVAFDGTGIDVYMPQAGNTYSGFTATIDGNPAGDYTNPAFFGGTNNYVGQRLLASIQGLSDGPHVLRLTQFDVKQYFVIDRFDIHFDEPTTVDVTLDAEAGDVPLGPFIPIFEPSLRASLVSSAEAGAVPIVGQDVFTGSQAMTLLDAEAGSVPLLGSDVEFASSYILRADADSISIAGTDATTQATFSYGVTAEAGTVVIAANDVSLVQESLGMLAAEIGSIPFTGQDVTFGMEMFYVMDAESGGVPVVGQDVLFDTDIAYRMTAEPGIVPVLGQDIVFAYDRAFTAEGGAIPLTGSEVTFSIKEVERFIVGYFPPGQNDVTISVVNPLNGNALSVASDACLERHPGAYVWDTANIQDNYAQALWTMTDGVEFSRGVHTDSVITQNEFNTRIENVPLDATTRFRCSVDDIANGIMQYGIEGIETFEQAIRLIRAEAAGSIERDGDTHRVKSADGTVDRIVADATELGRDVTETNP